MDLNEATGAVTNRHPWELSRTKCVLDEMSRFLGNPGKKAVYINAGAGDLYFDRALLKRYKNHHLHAIDIAYEDLGSDDERINKYHYFEEIDQEQADYAVMMDSLEYMEDDAAYIKKMCGKIKKGGYFFFTLPAFPFLFSDYDINVKNLRRYNRKIFADVLSRVPELEKAEEYYFYTSLFLVRFIQKMLHIPIDPGHKVTANWGCSESSMITRLLTVVLNLDFALNRLCGRFGVFLPGLSMIVVCRKV